MMIDGKTWGLYKVLNWKGCLQAHLAAAVIARLIQQLNWLRSHISQWCLLQVLRQAGSSAS